MANRRPNNEIDKVGIWSKANNEEYDKGYDSINWGDNDPGKQNDKGAKNNG